MFRTTARGRPPTAVARDFAALHDALQPVTPRLEIDGLLRGD